MSFRSDRGGGRGRRGFRGRGIGRGDFRGGSGRGHDAPARDSGGIFTASDQATSVDSRLLESDQSALVNAFNSVSLNSNDLPLRPGWGTSGTPIQMRSNFFAVKLPRRPLCEYDVKITPSVEIKRVKRRIFQLLEEIPDYARYKVGVAHDFGAKLFAARRLPQPLAFEVPFFDDGTDAPRPENGTYVVEINFVQDINFSALSSYLAGELQYRDFNVTSLLSALNIVLTQHPRREGVTVGRNRFFFPRETFSLGGGFEAWKGFHISVRPAYKQLMVNVNIATTAFYQEGNLADAMMEYKNATFGARVDGFLRGLRIVTHLRHKKTVRKTSRLSARTATFLWDKTGGQVTVENYFLQNYNITLRYPDMPLIELQGSRQTLIPAEVCQVLPGQPFRGKLTDEHTAQMVLHACKPPNVNALSIVNHGLSELGFRGDGAPPLPRFGIKVGGQMAVVPGRILAPPRVMYSQRAQDISSQASWNLLNVRFLKGATLDKWAVLIIKDGNNRNEFRGTDDPELVSTINGFINTLQTSGMTCHSKPKFIQAQLPQRNPSDPTRKAAIATIRNTITSLSPKVDLLLVILSNGDKQVYAGIKHLCDVRLDVHTVCVQVSKIRRERGQLQYFANIALKVNMKLGGINHSLDPDSMQWLKQELTMLVGMDVTHPSPGSLQGIPSIAAVVASVDEQFSQFPASLALQKSRQEMIADIEGLMIERLETFRARLKTLPKRVIIYRKGISGEQYKKIIEEEMQGIIKSFKKFDTEQNAYRPKFSIIICGGKHHRTRFYPMQEGDADKLGNPRPGTVVDQGVTSVYNFDFFLQSHGSVQGTTHPAYYVVVHDEIKFSADELQKLTNDMSYMIARATKATKLVGPAHYADLASERGQCYIQELLQQVENTTIDNNEDQVMRIAQNLWHNGVKGPLCGESMFYL